MSDSTSSSVEYRIDREQLNALKSATRRSKYSFDGDVGSISSALSQIDDSSPFVSTMKDYISGLLSDDSYDEYYQNAIDAVDYYL